MTHPDLDTRLTSIRADLQAMPAAVLKRGEDDRRFLRIQALLWARHGDPGEAMQFFSKKNAGDPLTLMGKGMISARQNKVHEAEQFFRQAVSLAKGDSLILREAGIFEYSKGNAQRARNYLEQALKADDRDYYGKFFYARLLDDIGDRASAQQLYREVLRYVPEDSEVHENYGRSLGISGSACLGYVHLAYASLFSGNMQKAKSMRERAAKIAATHEEKNRLAQYDAKASERAKILKKIH